MGLTELIIELRGRGDELSIAAANKLERQARLLDNISQEVSKMNETYRIVGLGAAEDEECHFSRTRATGYVEKNGDGMMIPANLNLFSRGVLGEEVYYIGLKTKRY